MKPSTVKRKRVPKAVSAPTPPAPTIDEGADTAAASEPLNLPASLPEPASIAHVKGVRVRMSMGDVKASLGEAWCRVEALQGAVSTLRLQDRLRASDGSCPPIVFTKDGSDEPKIFAGYDTLAAHFGYGTSELDVIIIAAGDAAEAQSALVSMMERPKQPNPYDDLASRFLAR